jgi:glycosyltransferase involved in cell wall biosynthesis
MKILYVTTGLNTGGAEMMLYRILYSINRAKFQPVVVSLIDRGTFADRIEALGIPVHTVGMERGFPTPINIYRLISLVKQIKPDIIQGWMYHGNIAAQFANFFTGNKTPVLWSIHHSIASLNAEKKTTIAIIKFGAYISRLATQILFVSHSSKSQHEVLGYAKHKSCVIPNGFDLSLFVPSANNRISVISELNLPESSFLIGVIGRDHPMKDHANFVRASAILLKEYQNVHFLMIGKGVDDHNAKLMQLIDDLGISDRISLLGERSDIACLISSLDILTSSSAYGESFPLVIGEAMACGVPCVVTDVGDSDWIVGDTGHVVPTSNPAALASAWQELLALDGDHRKNLGKAARTRIETEFSLDSVVSKYESLYEAL